MDIYTNRTECRGMSVCLCVHYTTHIFDEFVQNINFMILFGSEKRKFERFWSDELDLYGLSAPLVSLLNKWLKLDVKMFVIWTLMEHNRHGYHWQKLLKNGWRWCWSSVFWRLVFLRGWHWDSVIIGVLHKYLWQREEHNRHWHQSIALFLGMINLIVY